MADSMDHIDEAMKKSREMFVSLGLSPAEVAFAAEEGSKAVALAITEFHGSLLKGDSLRPVALAAAFAMALIHADAWAQTDQAKLTASALAKLAER